MVFCIMISCNRKCWLYMMILLYDVGYIEWIWHCSKFLYVVMTTDDDMCYVAKHYLWSPILFTWLCGVMGLHMSIALVGLGWDCCKGFVWYVDMILVIEVVFGYEHVLCYCDMLSCMCIKGFPNDLACFLKKWSLSCMLSNVLCSLFPYLVQVVY